MFEESKDTHNGKCIMNKILTYCLGLRQIDISRFVFHFYTEQTKYVSGS